jgi:hypothetical protein
MNGTPFINRTAAAESTWNIQAERLAERLQVCLIQSVDDAGSDDAGSLRDGAHARLDHRPHALPCQAVHGVFEPIRRKRRIPRGTL